MNILFITYEITELKGEHLGAQASCKYGINEW